MLSFIYLFIFYLFFFFGQRPLVPLLLLGLPFFSNYSFWSTTLLTGMTSISLHMQCAMASDFSVAWKMYVKLGKFRFGNMTSSSSNQLGQKSVAETLHIVSGPVANPTITSYKACVVKVITL
jgi:hypothetical protein